jgi:hypothetical protein
LVFVLFLACGIAFQPLTATPQALQGFQAMYYISSFFAQFVNATTFLLVFQTLYNIPLMSMVITDHLGMALCNASRLWEHYCERACARRSPNLSMHNIVASYSCWFHYSCAM